MRSEQGYCDVQVGIAAAEHQIRDFFAEYPISSSGSEVQHASAHKAIAG